MLKLMLIVVGFILIIFHQQFANYYRSFGRDKIAPVRWQYMEEAIIIVGIVIILRVLATLF